MSCCSDQKLQSKLQQNPEMSSLTTKCQKPLIYIYCQLMQSTLDPALQFISHLYPTFLAQHYRLVLLVFNGTFSINRLYCAI